MSSVDRSSALPLWAQIVADLRERMAGGAFDQRFPTEHELAATYGVSRQTVREAVRRLQDEGLLERHRGRGTTLSRPVLEQPLRTLYSLASTVSGHGLRERNEIRAAERRPAPPEVAEILQLAPGAPAVYLERLRFAGDDPLSLERSWLPWSTARGLLHADLAHGPLYQALLDRCGVRVTSGRERIAPALPSPVERRALRMRAGVAAFLVERQARAGEVVVELRWSTVRGDRYRFLAEWP